MAAIGTGAVVQFRFLGGAVGLAIASNIQNGQLAESLKDVLSSHRLHLFLENVKLTQDLSPELREKIRDVFAASYTTQLRVMIGFAAAQLLATLLLLKSGRQLAAKKHPCGG